MNIKVIALTIASMPCLTFCFEPISIVTGTVAATKAGYELYQATGEDAELKRKASAENSKHELALLEARKMFFACLSLNKSANKDSLGFPITCAKEVNEYEQTAGFEEVNKQRIAYRAMYSR